MSREILMNVTPRETRVALVENGVLQDIFIERTRKRGLVGNIYKGRVKRVLPGMQAAFVDVGLERTAFLHASDAVPVPYRDVVVPRPAAEPDAAPEKKASESITGLLREGQDIVVQVIKDQLGSKGARLTTQIAVPSRYLVFTPDVQGRTNVAGGRMPGTTGTPHIGVSQKIESADERQRLKDALAMLGPAELEGGYIVRTLAEGVSAQELSADREFLQKLWASIAERAAAEPAPRLLYEDLPLVLRTMRDLVGMEIEQVRVDSRETYQRVLDFAAKFTPELTGRIEHYPGERPIFDLYGVEDEIQKALERRVQLKSGGYLVIDQTEAMTTIDVNTGAFVGHRNLDETIFKTNLEAAQAIARQLRLRNLGGIIILDFIDMQNAEHRQQVLRALEKALERDRVRTHISGVSALGLVEMTRKRTRESLGHVLCEPCPVCKGRGELKSVETVCYEIFREILRAARQFEAQRFLVLASQEVVDLLLDEESASLAELEEFVGKPIKFQVESQYTQEQYDVVLT
ncbi:MAG: ribonuclease G [Gammaproteobacteria bacterium]|nr:MAG: ribonuclease G [Gammaproteobacteria bacterium]